MLSVPSIGSDLSLDINGDPNATSLDHPQGKRILGPSEKSTESFHLYLKAI